MPRKQAANPFYDLLKAPRHRYRTEEILQLFGSVSKSRVASLSQVLADYISTNLPEAISKREALADYRTNPYALLASANVLNLADPSRFADFLFNNKLYAG